MWLRDIASGNSRCVAPVPESLLYSLRAPLTDAQASAFVHAGGNPNLRTLARISALLDVELITWTNSDEEFVDALKVHGTSNR